MLKIPVFERLARLAGDWLSGASSGGLVPDKPAGIIADKYRSWITSRFKRVRRRARLAIETQKWITVTYFESKNAAEARSVRMPPLKRVPRARPATRADQCV